MGLPAQNVTKSKPISSRACGTRTINNFGQSLTGDENGRFVRFDLQALSSGLFKVVIGAAAAKVRRVSRACVGHGCSHARCTAPGTTGHPRRHQTPSPKTNAAWLDTASGLACGWPKPACEIVCNAPPSLTRASGGTVSCDSIRTPL